MNYAVLLWLRGITSPTDFSNNPVALETMKDAIEIFVQNNGRYPTITEAAQDQDFPNVNHYLETFGIWTKACEEVPMQNVQPITLEQELHYTLAYYSNKLGYDGKLMTKEDWDKLEHQNKKKLPSSHILKKYSGYESANTSIDENSGRKITNEWQALAVKANLDFDGRGRNKILDDLKNTKDTTGKYIADCMQSGKILSYEEWVDYCHEFNRSTSPSEKYLPATIEKLEKYIFHSKDPNNQPRGITLLQHRAKKNFHNNPENGQRFERNKLLREQVEAKKQELDEKMRSRKDGVENRSTKQREDNVPNIYDKLLEDNTIDTPNAERDLNP